MTNPKRVYVRGKWAVANPEAAAQAIMKELGLKLPATKAEARALNERARKLTAEAIEKARG